MPASEEPLGADEQALLDAFDRLSPQGGLRWGFDDAMRRIAQPDLDGASGASPWPGLPDDLWDRGRSARIGQRFVGDVAGVLADILAADARAAADAAVEAVNGDRFVATWDALRFLAARVEALEARAEPLGLAAAELPVPVPDPGEWLDRVGTWLADRSGDDLGTVLVGESGEGALAGALARGGRRVVGVEPRGEPVWRSLGESGSASAAGGGPVEVVLAEVAPHLATLPGDGLAGVVLMGCVDRADLAGKLGLLAQAVRVTGTGGAVVVLATEQAAWDASLTAPARDLAPGRPFHPETWSMLLRRWGATEVAWHRPVSGVLHAVVARLGR